LVVSQTLPNLARGLVSEDVAQGALVPLVREELDKGDVQAAISLTRRVGVASTLILTVISAVLALIAGHLRGLLAPGLDGGASRELVTMLRIMIPTIVLNGVGAASSALLVSSERLMVASVATAWSNVPVVGFLLVVPSASATAIAVAIAVGLLIQALFQVLASRIVGRQLLRAPAQAVCSRGPGLKIVAALALPVALSLGLANLSGVIDAAFASVVAEGGPAAFDKAFRLMLVPYGAVGIGLAVAALPGLVSRNAESQAAFDRHLMTATRLQVAALVPLGLVLIGLAEPIVRLVYGHGSFDQPSIKLTAEALRSMGVCLPALGLGTMGARAWMSRKRPWVPALVALGGMALNLVLDAVLYRPLGIFGIGLATAVVHASVGLALLVAAVGSPAVAARALGDLGLRVAASGLVALAAAAGVVAVAGSARGLALITATIAGAVAYVVAAHVAGIHEHRQIAARLGSVLRRA
jgi:putative peptidoglycan lipid II flippase